MIGIDLVQISDFNSRLSKGQPLDKVFTDTELQQNPRVESLAGVFAAKEAFFKAIGEKKEWLEVWLEKMPSGQPKIYSRYLNPAQRVEVSISHSGDFVVAVVLIHQ